VVSAYIFLDGPNVINWENINGTVGKISVVIYLF
jgi:hypothetical protein